MKLRHYSIHHNTLPSFQHMEITEGRRYMYDRHTYLRDNKKSYRQWWRQWGECWNSLWTSSITWCCSDACLRKTKQCHHCILHYHNHLVTPLVCRWYVYGKEGMHGHMSQCTNLELLLKLVMTNKQWTPVCCKGHTHTTPWYVPTFIHITLWSLHPSQLTTSHYLPIYSTSGPCNGHIHTSSTNIYIPYNYAYNTNTTFSTPQEPT